MAHHRRYWAAPQEHQLRVVDPAALLERLFRMAQVVRRVDERDVAKGLGEIPEQALLRRVIFFR